MDSRPSVRAYVVAAIVVAAAAGGITAALDDPDRSSVSPPATPAPAPPRGDFHGDAGLLRNELPGPPQARAVQLETLEQAEQRVERMADPRPRPTGGAQNYTFRTAYDGTPYGRSGGQKRLVVIHCTVGRNQPGWGDVYGTKSYLDRVGLSASWIADFEAHFLKTMPTAGNPYTQGRFFNQYALSIELVSTCQETRAQWLASPLFRDRALASWLADRLREIGAPFRRVDPAGCNAPVGYTDHAALECINDHTDISFQCRNGGEHPRDFRVPTCSFPWDLLARQLADGPDAPNRKLRIWRRGHRIGHARLAKWCKDGGGEKCAAIRDRTQLLHRLVVREKRRG